MKVDAAENVRNKCNLEFVAREYDPDSKWRKPRFFQGREAIMKELWCYTENRISLRFEYEWNNAVNPIQSTRTHSNEHWVFDDNGLMRLGRSAKN